MVLDDASRCLPMVNHGQKMVNDDSRWSMMFTMVIDGQMMVNGLMMADDC